MQTSVIDQDLISQEWPKSSIRGIYLNSGSCGVKPRSVLDAIKSGWDSFNENPTIATFIDKEVWEKTRNLAAQLFNCESENLILTQNSTYGIQLVMQSLLLETGDEIVSTNMEHSCVKTLCTHLEKERGIVLRQHNIDAFAGSEKLCAGILSLVNSKTRLVLVSEINCLNGWRPQLAPLAAALEAKSIALLVDGAHSPGQGPLQISKYPFWVASGHKWMGAPNGTGFLYVRPDWQTHLKPLIIGDRFLNPEFSFAHKFEWPGTCDVVRFMGLQAALKLQLKLGPAQIAARQKELHRYLRTAIEHELKFPATLRTPLTDGETSALYAISWPVEKLRTVDLRESLWSQFKIWTQPDYNESPFGAGMRISCHIFNTEKEIDTLISALKTQFK